LFPAWHRAYLWDLEDALRTIEGGQDVTLPFWDQTLAGQPTAIPPILLSQNFTFKKGNKVHPKGQTIPNPIYSFKLPAEIPRLKPVDYNTVRYPLAGFARNAAEIAQSKQHNAQYPNPILNAHTLDVNVQYAIRTQPYANNPPPVPRGILYQYQQAVQNAPNFTAFSNTTSANDYNAKHPSPTPVVPLEQPHNGIHGSIGVTSGYNPDRVNGASGDMGWQNTAGLDPIFYFHHTFVDYVWWQWQKIHGKTDLLEIDPTLAGTGSGANKLTVDTPLNPFKIGGSAPTTKTLTNINKVGYEYGPGSLDPKVPGLHAAALAAPAAPREGYIIRVPAVDRTKYVGSFSVRVYSIINGHKELVDETYVFGPTEVEQCENCRDHLKVDVVHAIPGHFDNVVSAASLLGQAPSPGTVAFVVEVEGQSVPPPLLARAPRADEGPSSTVVAEQLPFEVRHVQAH